MYVVWNEGKIVKKEVNVGFYDNGQWRGQCKGLLFYVQYNFEPFYSKATAHSGSLGGQNLLYFVMLRRWV